MTSTRKFSPQKLMAIKKANKNTDLFARNRAQGVSDTDTLAAIIRNPKKRMIVGVWGDSCEADLCGLLVIKGGAIWSDLDGVSVDDIDAIHCTCAEEAMAMRRVFGDEAQGLH
jgi:hypothetical protein